jgi:coenzyme PQQ synthesis protein D (PqqD)
VLVPLVTHGADLDAIFNLNAVGAFIWERLDGRTTGEAIVAALVEAFDVGEALARSDYLGFVAQLQGLQAVDLAGEGAS